MAFPLIPLLLMAGSVGANKLAENKVKRARNRALDLAEQNRLKSREKSEAAAQSTADLFVNAAKNQDARAAELEAEYKGAQAPVPTAEQAVPAGLHDVIAPSGSTATIQATADRATKARAYTDQLAAARAKLAAFGDVMVDANIGANRNAMEISREAQNLSNWNQYVLPWQLEQANKRGRGWNTAADVLQAAGQLYTMGALTAPTPAVNTLATGSLAGETAASVGAVNSAASDFFAQQQLLDFAKNLRMPTVGY